jgi:hypothetical protein
MSNISGPKVRFSETEQKDQMPTQRSLLSRSNFKLIGSPVEVYRDPTFFGWCSCYETESIMFLPPQSKSEWYKILSSQANVKLPQPIRVSNEV